MNVRVKYCLLLQLLLKSVFSYSSDFYSENSKFHRAILEGSDVTNFQIWRQNHSEDVICCANGQWEANAYLLFGSVIDIPETNSFFYYNGTGKIVIDDVLRKSYVMFNITAYSPQIPVYSNFTTTTIKDFQEGISYQIDDDGHCMKQTIARNMLELCIRKSSTKVAVGLVGTKVVSTYQYTTEDGPGGRDHVTTASIIQNDTRCVPVSISRAELDTKDASHGTISNLDITDFTRRKIDPATFALPKSCNL